jgi:hypothetical protein
VGFGMPAVIGHTFGYFPTKITNLGSSGLFKQLFAEGAIACHGVKCPIQLY